MLILFKSLESVKMVVLIAKKRVRAVFVYMHRVLYTYTFARIHQLKILVTLKMQTLSPWGCLPRAWQSVRKSICADWSMHGW